MHPNNHRAIACIFMLFACNEKESNQQHQDNKPEETTQQPQGPMDTSAKPLFIIAGQSNAEGNVRFFGFEALRDALPDHNNALNVAERETLRDAYRDGVGDWCNPAEDYSVAAADAAIDAFRDSQMDISHITSTYTVTGAEMIAFRWGFQEANEELSEPYENPSPSAHPAQTTQVAPLGPGFGIWDNEETEVLFYGPELGFGIRMDQTSTLGEFDVLKVAMGGSSLYQHWSPDGPLRRQLYERTDAFLATREGTSVQGLLWFQGFNDQFEDAYRDNYEANLTTLLTDFRIKYGEDVPIVIVQARRVGDLELIADAQQAVADSMPQVAIVKSDGLSECFHYDATSQLVIGQRSADAMLQLHR